MMLPEEEAMESLRLCRFVGAAFQHHLAETQTIDSVGDPQHVMDFLLDDENSDACLVVDFAHLV